jgi:hypothetical protein
MINGCTEVSNIDLDAIAIIRGRHLGAPNPIVHLVDILTLADEFQPKTSSSDEQ